MNIENIKITELDHQNYSALAIPVNGPKADVDVNIVSLNAEDNSYSSSRSDISAPR